MILLDTHTWLWWIQLSEELPALLRREIDETEEEVAISPLSCLEVAWLARRGRIDLHCSAVEWFAQAIHQAGLVVAPLTPLIAARAAALPEIHKDPIDRILIATAIEENARLFSRDGMISRYPEVKVVWHS